MCSHSNPGTPGNTALRDYANVLAMRTSGRRDSFSLHEITQRELDEEEQRQEELRSRAPMCPGLTDQQYSYMLMFNCIPIWEMDDPDPWPLLDDLNAARTKLEQLCRTGDINAIKRVCEEWRVRKPALGMRYFERSHCFRNGFGGSVQDINDERWGEEARWDVIRCLIEEGFDLNPPHSGCADYINFPIHIAERAIGKGTGELEKLLQAGWDINSCRKVYVESRPVLA
jgi:hypothetical protein